MRTTTRSSPLWTRVSKGTAAEIAKDIIKYIVLWAIPPGVGVMGWLQDLPWFYVSVGVIVSGAGLMTWLVQLDEWRSRNRVDHKLSIAGMRIHLTQATDRMAAIRFGFNLRNTSTFPITFKIDNLKSKLTQGNNTLYPPNREYINNVISIPPGGIGFFDDHAMVLPDDFNGDTSAELQCKVFYGKADRFDHELELNKVTFINFTGSVASGGQHWYDQIKTVK